MLGVILLYVGMVLMSNGLHRLEGIPDKSNVVMNIFTGGLGLILNIIVIAYGACTGQGAEWFYGSATGLLFAFTYLYSAINTIFDFDQRLYGWFSLFVAINTLPAGILCLTSGYGGNAWYGIIWFLWCVLWLTAFIEINLKNNRKEGAKSWRLLKLEKAIAYREAGQYPLSNDKLEKIIEELKKIMVNKGNI